MERLRVGQMVRILSGGYDGITGVSTGDCGVIVGTQGQFLLLADKTPASKTWGFFPHEIRACSPSSRVIAVPRMTDAEYNERRNRVLARYTGAVERASNGGGRYRGELGRASARVLRFMNRFPHRPRVMPSGARRRELGL
jgi:hypothetical protein